jgi:hypothetical protein
MLEFLAVAGIHVRIVIADDRERRGAQISVPRTRHKVGREKPTLFIYTTARERASPEQLLVEPGVQSASIDLGRMPLEWNTDTKMA